MIEKIKIFFFLHIKIKLNILISKTKTNMIKSNVYQNIEGSVKYCDDTLQEKVKAKATN